MSATRVPEGIDAIPDEVFENTLWETIAMLQNHVQDDRELVAAVMSLLAYRVPDDGMPEAY
jgi:hypothetical protein